jgi:hypothetical protein
MCVYYKGRVRKSKKLKSSLCVINYFVLFKIVSYILMLETVHKRHTNIIEA